MTRIKKVIWSGALIVLLGAVVMTLFGERGVRDLYNRKGELARIETTNARLRMENRDLYREVDRLKHDRKYIETIARQELGLVGEDEIILRSQ